MNELSQYVCLMHTNRSIYFVHNVCVILCLMLSVFDVIHTQGTSYLRIETREERHMH